MRRPWHKTYTGWLTLWSAAIVTYVVLTNQSGVWVASVSTMCGAILLAYIGGNQAVNYRHGPDQVDSAGKGGGE